MKLCISLLAIVAALVLASGHRDNIVGAASAPPPTMGFFVSTKNKTGNLGGLAGADRLCQNLAAAVGRGDKTWRAYLSAERDPDNNNNPTDARSRIGNGPWFNANGLMVGKDLADLHARRGNPILLLVDERGQAVPGNWTGSPKPTEHDILTGSTPEGTVMAGKTCNSWTSEASDVSARVGHSDGISTGGDTSASGGSWNSAHDNQSCSDTAPRGGAGRFYCFAAK